MSINLKIAMKKLSKSNRQISQQRLDEQVKFKHQVVCDECLNTVGYAKEGYQANINFICVRCKV